MKNPPNKNVYYQQGRQQGQPRTNNQFGPQRNENRKSPKGYRKAKNRGQPPRMYPRSSNTKGWPQQRPYQSKDRDYRRPISAKEAPRMIFGQVQPVYYNPNYTQQYISNHVQEFQDFRGPPAPAQESLDLKDFVPYVPSQLPATSTTSQPASDFGLRVQDKVQIPDQYLTLDDISNLKTHHQSSIDQLYTGRQCSNCSLRFNQDQKERYAEHLDAHFRENRREKQAAKIANHREWNYTLAQWTGIKDPQSIELPKAIETPKTSHSIYLHLSSQISDYDSWIESIDTLDSSKCSVEGFDSKSSCEICREDFTIKWHDDSDSWRLMGAVRFAGVGIFHSLCLKDYLGHN